MASLLEGKAAPQDSNCALFLLGRHRHAAFRHVVAHRFLDVHVLAGLAGPDRRQRMPVVRDREEDGVDGAKRQAKLPKTPEEKQALGEKFVLLQTVYTRIPRLAMSSIFRPSFAHGPRLPAPRKAQPIMS